MTPRYAIRYTDAERLRWWYFKGFCPESGRPVWTFDRTQAQRIADHRCARAMLAALYIEGLGAADRYAVVEIDEAAA